MQLRADPERVGSCAVLREISLQILHGHDEAGIAGPVVPDRRGGGQQGDDAAVAERAFHDQGSPVAEFREDAGSGVGIGLPAVGGGKVALNQHGGQEAVAFAGQDAKHGMIRDPQVRPSLQAIDQQVFRAR